VKHQTGLRARTFFKTAADNESGNVVMIFGLTVFILMGFIGAAIDMSRVNIARHHIQDAADAAVLRTMSMSSATDAVRAKAADQVFTQNMHDTLLSHTEKTLTGDVNSNRISQTYTVSAMVPSYFGAFLGKDEYPISVVSQAQVDLQQYEIAMVLDTTGSMAQLNKMTNLKSSVSSALNGLLNSSGENISKSKVSIVPFNDKVRVSNDVMTAMKTAGLVNGTTGSCIIDRNQPYDVSVDAADKLVVATQYTRAACYNDNIKEIQGLNDNISQVKTAVNGLKPDGMTNITVGIQWGMETLSTNQPFVSTVAFKDSKVKKVMIVVTDGDNTQNRWTTSESEINKRTAKACVAAKAQGILVYTVKVIEGDSAMLRTCASDPKYFYDLTSASQLNATMSGIFKSIYQTHLTQ
jgi:Flp pilus assembly protein TadG